MVSAAPGRSGAAGGSLSAHLRKIQPLLGLSGGKPSPAVPTHPPCRPVEPQVCSVAAWRLGAGAGTRDGCRQRRPHPGILLALLTAASDICGPRCAGRGAVARCRRAAAVHPLAGGRAVARSPGHPAQVHCSLQVSGARSCAGNRAAPATDAACAWHLCMGAPCCPARSTARPPQHRPPAALPAARPACPGMRRWWRSARRRHSRPALRSICTSCCSWQWHCRWWQGGTWRMGATRSQRRAAQGRHVRAIVTPSDGRKGRRQRRGPALRRCPYSCILHHALPGAAAAWHRWCGRGAPRSVARLPPNVGSFCLRQSPFYCTFQCDL